MRLLGEGEGEGEGGRIKNATNTSSSLVFKPLVLLRTVRTVRT